MQYLSKEDFKNHLESRNRKSKAGKINNTTECPLCVYIKTDKDVGYVSVDYDEIVIGSKRGIKFDKVTPTPKWAKEFIDSVDGDIGGSDNTHTTVSYGRCLNLLNNLT